jgi:hypothetical protein
VKNVRKPYQFLLMLSGGGCSEFLAMAEFIEDVHNLLESFHGGSLVDTLKTLCCPLVCDESPNIGHWT